MMNSNETLDDIQWQTLIQQTAGFFSDLTIKRGFQYYKQGRVHASEPADETGVVEASVDGTETYRTKLHLRSLSDSECSCPVKDGCKHMVAVLLDYAQLQGRSIHALVNAHSTTYASTSSYDRSESGFSPAQDRPSAGASKWRVKADHLPDLPISAWHELFEVCTASLGTNTQNSFYAKMRWLPSITLNPRFRQIWIRYTSSMRISSFSRSSSSSPPVPGIPPAPTSAIIHRWQRIISWPELSASSTKGWRSANMGRHSGSD